MKKTISLEEVKLDIMNISYSKGGDYSDEMIRSFAMVYIDEFLYCQITKDFLRFKVVIVKIKEY